MEHDIVTSVNYDDGVVYCDLQTVRTTTGMPGVPVLKPHSGFVQVPSQGDLVTVEKLGDGTPFITNIIANADGAPEEMKEGEFAIQLDKGTRVAFKRKENGDYDLHLESSGDVMINGVAFSEHTHSHEDSTTESTTTKKTTKPTNFTDG